MRLISWISFVETVRVDLASKKKGKGFVFFARALNAQRSCHFMVGSKKINFLSS